MITVQVDTRDATRYLDRVQKQQIPFATSVALNRTAKLAEADIKDDLRRVLDNPKPYTLGGTFVANSTKRNLTAIVGLKDKATSGRAAGTYLRPLVAGIPRHQTGWEKALEAIGALPRGMRAVPADGAKLDRFGNMDKRQVTEIMGALRTRMRTFKGRGKRAHAGGYFVAMPGASATAHLEPGIYYRIERAGESVIKPVVVFVDQARYTQTIKLATTVHKTVAQHFQREFDSALSQALATAR